MMATTISSHTLVIMNKKQLSLMKTTFSQNIMFTNNSFQNIFCPSVDTKYTNVDDSNRVGNLCNLIQSVFTKCHTVRSNTSNILFCLWIINLHIIILLRHNISVT